MYIHSNVHRHSTNLPHHVMYMYIVHVLYMYIVHVYVIASHLYVPAAVTRVVCI